MHHESASSLSLLKTLTRFLKPFRGRFVAATFFRIVNDAFGLYPPFALASLVTFFTNYTPGDSLRTFWIIMLIWLVTSFTRFLSRYYSSYWGYQIGERIGLDGQIETIRHLFLLDMVWHEKENSGNKLKKIDRGGEYISRTIRLWFDTIIGVVINLIGVIYITSTIDAAIALWMALFLVTYFIISFEYNKRGTKAARKVNAAEEDMSGLLFESINNIRSVKIMSMTNPLFERLVTISNDVYEKVKKRIFWYQSGGSVKNTWSQIFMLSIIVFIGIGITQGRYEVGFIILFYGYFSNVIDSVAKLADSAQDLSVAKYSVKSMMDMIDTPVEIDKEEDKVPFPTDWQKISISNLSFSYGDKKVLDSISFDIKRGEKIGIIGLSGAGKSTIFKMLLKEREDYSGDIFIDDVPLKTISKKSYFNHAAVVLQDTEVFNFSLRDNITISNIDKAEETDLFNKSLEIAHVTEFAHTLPQGLDTLIGEKGVRLSGGEKQRVGIARAVFKNPDLLLLDEATSHLDIESEEIIRDSLHQFFKTVTAVVIAHRLTTIKEMDRILVLENGKIIESGNFSELHSRKGRFYDLWEKQKL